MNKFKTLFKKLLIKLHIIKPFPSTYYRDMCYFQKCLEELDRKNMSFNDYIQEYFNAWKR